MRLIDADALGVGRCSRDLLPASYCAGWNGLVNLIEQAPTIDAVPVVRCKHCEHFYPWFRDVGMCNFHSQEVDGDVTVKEVDFCSYGERKDGDGK